MRTIQVTVTGSTPARTVKATVADDPTRTVSATVLNTTRTIRVIGSVDSGPAYIPDQIDCGGPYATNGA